MSWETLLLRLALASAEIAILAVIVTAGVHLLRVRSPRVRSLLWLLILVKPLLTLAGVTMIPVTTTAALVAVFVGEPALPAVAPMIGGEPSAAPLAWTHWLGYLWLVGVCVMGVSLARDGLRLRRILKRTSHVSGRLLEIYGCAAAELGVVSPPPVRSTVDLRSPALVGFLRPVILMPRWLTHVGDASQVRWACKHELAHFKARDTLAGLIREVTQVLFFFHPVVWWCGARWEEAREMACDRSLVCGGAEAKRYARVLFGILEQARHQRHKPVASAVYAIQTQIGRRIRSLLRDPPSETVRRPGAFAGSLAFCIVSMCLSIADVTGPRDPTKTDGMAASAPTATEPLDDGKVRVKILCSSMSQGGRVERELDLTRAAEGALQYRFRVDGCESELDSCGRQLMILFERFKSGDLELKTGAECILVGSPELVACSTVLLKGG